MKIGSESSNESGAFMLKHILVCLIALFSHSVAAQVDPCALIENSPGIVPKIKLKVTPGVIACYAPGGNQIVLLPELTVRLSGLSVSENQALLAEIRGLRGEIISYSANLVQARMNFEIATKEAIEGQRKWRQEALDRTLADVAAIPSRLAEDPQLKSDLLLIIKAELLNDPDFLRSLKDNVNQ